MLTTELLRFDNYYKQLSDISRVLDPLNVKILEGMSSSGPRNLLEVSRRTEIPFTTVYHRVGKLESRVGRIAHLAPSVSRLGLTCVVVINNAKPGYEDRLTTALKLPNYWWTVTRCEGGFTHHSVHCVPIEHLSGYDRYLRLLSRYGLADVTRIIHVGDYFPVNLDFKLYDAKEKTWRFAWDKWFDGLNRAQVVKKIFDPPSYSRAVDKKDLLIVKELQKDGRKTLTELSPMLGITLQGVKYHYDRLAARGVCNNFWTNVLPYPIEISAIYEIMIDFQSRERMNRFFSFLNNLFFIINVTKVLGKTSLILRAYLPETQVSKLFEFLSATARKRILATYSVVRLRYETRESQTISYELFDDKKGWAFDYANLVAEARRIS
jgi:DNA-binding Lrp family transcriptional regulator